MNREAGRSVAGQRQELVAILPNVRRFAMSLTGNLPDADDLLQATVERLLQRGLPADVPLLPYTLRSCRNLWIDEIRSRKVRQAATLDPSLQEGREVSGEQQAVGELSVGEVQAVLGEMPAEQRAVLELVAVEGYSYRQASEVLDIPIGTVMSRLARARTTLVEKLDT